MLVVQYLVLAFLFAATHNVIDLINSVLAILSCDMHMPRLTLIIVTLYMKHS